MLENLKIQNNIIENSYKSGVEKLMFLLSPNLNPTEFTPPPRHFVPWKKIKPALF